MSDRTGPTRQRGIALLMSLVFLMLLVLAGTALVDNVVWQNRLGVAQQQAREQFQQTRGAVDYASLEVSDLPIVTDKAGACDWQVLSDQTLVTQVATGREVNARRLRLAYDCIANGNSESVCKPIEVAETGGNTASGRAINQIQGLQIVTPRLTDQRMASFSNAMEETCR